MTDDTIEAVIRLTRTGEHYRQPLTREDIKRGWIEMPCPECAHNGSNGVFTHPDGSDHPCVHCSTSGKVMASLPPAPTRGVLGAL